MAVYLVCEGSSPRLDERVLDALVIQFNNLKVLTAATGGKSGHGAVRAYFENRVPADVAISVEDRDYRPQGIGAATWRNQGGRSFVWRRHEIENYLLHPRVVLELFNDLRTVPGQAWANQLPTSEPAVSALLHTIVTPLLEEHAAEVLRCELVQLINGLGGLSFGPQRPSPAAGAHTRGQAEWLPALQQEATRMCQTCNSVAALPALQPGPIVARYGVLLAQFQNPAFLTSGEYLMDMGGKDILAALSRYMHGLHAPAQLSQSFLADEFLKVLARIYQPNMIYQPDCFAELATILGQY